MENLFIASIIAKNIQSAGGRAMFVGGYCRDMLAGIDPKDVDIEVYGLNIDILIDILSGFGRVDIVGKAFGVIKLTTDTEDFDFSVPRRDNKCGVGHRGFSVFVDPNMTVAEAATRRDFTWNAIAIDCLTGEIHDHFGGRDDFAAGIIRHTSPQFSEDPLRVLRGFQFAGRYGFSAAPETVRICRSLYPEYQHLPKERIWGEWMKWAEKSITPSAGLRFLLDTGWLAHTPEVSRLVGLKQDPEYHPEGDVWTHTLLAVDSASEICRRDGITGNSRLVAMFGALLHDVGKATTTVIDGGRIKSPGHAGAGKEIASCFLERIGCPLKFRPAIISAVTEHMAHVSGERLSDRAIRRLLNRLECSIQELGIVVESDHSARAPLAGGMPEAFREILERAEGLAVSATQPILTGRHVLALGVKPGPIIGNVLRRAFEAQLDGLFHSPQEGLVWLRENWRIRLRY